jgi:hypothetical protein
MMLGSLICAGLLAAAARAVGPAPDPAPAPVRAPAVREPSPISVPAALKSRVPALEMSGLAWAPSIERYLVVVDDAIDLEDNARHGPFVLALDRAGKFDTDPVPIVGVDEVDDAEALAAGGGNTYYLLTSHSPNKKGKLKKARRQLLELALEGRQLKVRHGVDLFEGKGDIGKVMARLGFPESTAVDLEGLAFHNGALYVGLKSPLLANDAAAILRIEHPSELFARGKVGKGELAPWGEVKLAVPGGDGKTPVPQGVADLFFAPDGALYLCANSPKGRANDGGGALWRVAKPTGGKLEATLVRQFSHLKPEGVTVAPGGAALTVVFDHDRKDPLWITWPLAR